MEIIRGWMAEKNYRGTIDYICAETKEEMIEEIKRLHPSDQECIVYIQEAQIARAGKFLEPIWSDDFPAINSWNGLRDGEYIDDENLEALLFPQED